MDSVWLGRPISLEDLEAVAVRGKEVELDPDARKKVKQGREAIESLLHQRDPPSMYGVNTGFGALSEKRIPPEAIRPLQRNLIRSHATGVGPPLSIPQVRAMICLRAQVLALGHSGVRVELVECLIERIRRRLHPRIPSQGSVGASGDLAPLAHLALPLIGEGELAVEKDKEVNYRPSQEVLQKAGVKPIELEAKEGLALINGTQYMTALGALTLLEAERLADIADIAGAMSLEALKGSIRPFDPRLHQLRPHPGQIQVADRLRSLLAQSEIQESHRNCGKVQDAYSIRCMPQVHGAARDALAWVRTVLEREINSVTDNPSLFLSSASDTIDLVSGGNFHGQPVAFTLDLAAMAVAELASISERRVEQMVNPAFSSGLSPFLAASSGLESGYMIAQVTSAALVSENKILTHPASTESIPTSAGKEDHVSIGSISAKEFVQVVQHVRSCLAIELLVAASGLDQRAPLKSSAAIEAVRQRIRLDVPPLTADRPFYRDIEAIDARIQDGSLLAATKEAISS